MFHCYVSLLEGRLAKSWDFLAPLRLRGLKTKKMTDKDEVARDPEI